MPFYPRVAVYLEKLKEIYSSKEERHDVGVLERLAREVDEASSRKFKIDKFYEFMLSVTLFKDYWGIRSGAEEVYNGIFEVARKYIIEEL